MSAFKAHPKALVESETIGDGTRIWAHAHIQNNVHIGADCNIGDACFLESGVRIGNGVVIKNNIAIYDGVVVEDFAFLGPNVVFTNDMIPRSRHLPEAQNNYNDDNWLVKTLIKRGASLGANVTVVCGNSVGEYSFVGAGSVVTKDVAPYSIVFGSPAKHRGWICRCGKTIHQAEGEYQCSRCQSRYHISIDHLEYLGREE